MILLASPRVWKSGSPAPCPPDDECLFLFSCLVVHTTSNSTSIQTHRRIRIIYYFLFVQPINNTNLRLSPGSEHFWYRQCSVGKNLNILNCATISENCFVCGPQLGFWLFHYINSRNFLFQLPAWPIVIALKNI